MSPAKALHLVASVAPQTEWTYERVEAIIWPLQPDGSRLHFGQNVRGHFAWFRNIGGEWRQEREFTDSDCELIDTLDGVIVTWSERLSNGMLVATEWDWCV